MTDSDKILEWANWEKSDNHFSTVFNIKGTQIMGMFIFWTTDVWIVAWVTVSMYSFFAINQLVQTQNAVWVQAFHEKISQHCNRVLESGSVYYCNLEVSASVRCENIQNMPL